MRLAKDRADAPFGGVRIILVGDLGQLAPVDGRRKDPVDPTGKTFIPVHAHYAFRADVWPSAAFKCFRLTHCYRYDVQSDLGRFLAELRGTPKLTEELFDVMEPLVNREFADSDKDAVMLCSKKSTARKHSESALSELEGPEYSFYGVDRHGRERFVNTANSMHGGDVNDNMEEGPSFIGKNNRPRPAWGSMPSEAVTVLKKGAKVIATSKFKDVKVGSAGVVIKFVRVNCLKAGKEVTRFDTIKGVTKEMVLHDWKAVCTNSVWVLVKFKVNGKSTMVLVSG